MWGKSKRILELYHSDNPMSYREIAAAVGCSSANVAQTIKRYRAWDHKVVPLTPEAEEWINEMAARVRLHPSLFVCKLLEKVIMREIRNGSDDE